MNITKNIFSVDAETDGLWGKSFAIAAIVFNTNGEDIDRFIFRCDAEIQNEWVKNNVLPAISDIPVLGSRQEMLSSFAEFYMKHKDTCDVLWHMGHIVESELFRELYENKLIGEWDAPYVPIELSAYLNLYGENSDSPDTYVKDYNLNISDYGTTHNPLYDCEVAGRVFLNLLKK